MLSRALRRPQRSFRMLSQIDQSLISPNSLGPVQLSTSTEVSQTGVLPQLLDCLNLHPFQNMRMINEELFTFLTQQNSFTLAASVVMISLGWRTLLALPQLASMNNAIRMKVIQPQLKEIMSNLKACMARGDRTKAQQIQAQRKLLLKKHKINSARGLLSLFTIPAYFSIFWFFRNVSSNAEFYAPGVDRAFLWMQDITMPDPYFIIPVVSGIFSFLGIKLSNSFMPATEGFFQKYRIYFPFLPLFSIIPLSTFPALLNIYWASISLIHLLLYRMVSLPVYSQFLGIKPEALTESGAHAAPQAIHVAKMASFEPKAGPQSPQAPASEEKPEASGVTQVKVYKSNPNKPSKRHHR